MSELQPGMLALVIGFNKVCQNLGKIVELSHFVNKGELAIAGPGKKDFWVIKGEGVGYTVGGEIIIGSVGLAEPKHLLPIRPQSDPLDQKQQQELHA